MDWYVLTVCCVWVGLLVRIEAKGPPKVISRVHRRQIASVGQTVKLTCPVEADPLPFLDWTKDDQSINSGWERFKMLNKGLRIKDAVEEDSGKYVCKATNGYGSVTVDYYLYVFPDTNDTVTPPFDFEGNLYPEDGAPPHFLRLDQMKSEPFEKPVGSALRLKCKAGGDPPPSIIWFKDGRVLTSSEGESSRHQHWTLRLHDLQQEDSGQYTCKVSNQAGVINFTYTLNVVDQIHSKPVLLAPHPENSTVLQGGVASFQCKVKSETQPHIQWLKQLDPGQVVHNTNTTIIVKGRRFRVLKTDKVYPQRDGSYLNKLVIHKVTDKDAGMYICLAANSMGYYSFRKAFLTVLRDPSQVGHGHRDENYYGLKSPSLPLIIAVPAAVIILIVIISFYVLHRRRRANAKKSKSVVRQHCRVPPLASAQDKHHEQYAALQAQQIHAMQQQQKPHMNMNPNYGMGMAANGGPMMHGAPSRERILKNYSDVHSDISLPKVPPPSQASLLQSFQQHQHMHYGC